MAKKNSNDEAALIDLSFGQADAADEQQLSRRLGEDADLRKLQTDIGNTFAALKAGLPDAEPPADLVDKTLAFIQSSRRTNELIARQETQHRNKTLTPTFSMRELLAIAASIILLVTIFVPSILQMRHNTLARNCSAQAGQIGTALSSYASENADLLPSLQGNYSRWLPGRNNEPVASNSANLYKLVSGNYVSATAFQCPAVGGQGFTPRQGAKDFPSAQYVNYSYQHTVGAAVSRKCPAVAAAAGTMAVLADSTPLFVNGNFCCDRVCPGVRSENHGGRGQNVLYMDSHVAWADRSEVGVGGDNIYTAQGIASYTGEEKPANDTDTFLLPSMPAGD